MNLETLTAFVGWCAVLNIGALVVAGVFWIIGKEVFSKLGAKFFGVTAEELKATFLRVFLQDRAGIFLLAIVPYFALKIIA